MRTFEAGVLQTLRQLGDRLANLERRVVRNVYTEGTWTPTWTGLTVVGAPTYAGRYTRIGNIVFVIVEITAGGANTTASTAGVTFINNLPFTAAQYSSSVLVSNISTDIAIGAGHIRAAAAIVLTPTWAATNANIVISGWYEI